MARNNSSSSMTVSEFVDMCSAYEGLAYAWEIEICTDDEWVSLDSDDSFSRVMMHLSKYGTFPVTDLQVNTYGHGGLGSFKALSDTTTN